jgi:hypothetical protein
VPIGRDFQFRAISEIPLFSSSLDFYFSYRLGQEYNRIKETEIDMLSFILIGLSLSLFGLAAVQFFYLNYLERLDRSRKKHIHDLEARCKRLEYRLDAAAGRIEEQDILIEAYEREEDEVWAEVIEERGS